MLIYENLDIPLENNGTSIALGNFDGVHIGHAAVIRCAVDSGSLTSCVLTYKKLPLSVLTGKKAQKITPTSIKRKAVEKLGIEVYINIDFETVRNLSPEEFVVLLKEKLNAKKLCCGYNFCFGKDRSGDTETLIMLGKKHDIEVNIMPQVIENGEAVSSTRIRKAIANGEMEQASRLLCRNFAFDFKVITGDQRGRLLGTPTINQLFPTDFIKPKFGVYASFVTIDNKKYKAVTNIGIRPTFETSAASAETFIIDFKGNLYGQNIMVELTKFIRAEQKFSGIDTLKAQIDLDVQQRMKME